MFLCDIVILAFIALIIAFISLFFIDSDISLAIKLRFGKKIDKFRGKVIWITGASSGIGEELAVVLSSVGAKLVISARRVEELQRVKERCLCKSKGKLEDSDILVLQFDNLDYESHESNTSKVIKHFEKIDMLVNNAGRSQRGYFINTDVRVHREIFELNLISIMSLTKQVLPHMIKNGGGQIVNVSSLCAFIPVLNSATYASSKAGLDAFCNCLRNEHNKDNIKVTIVNPGPVFSNFLQNAFSERAGQDHGESTSPSDQRMATDRCAFLIATAAVNQMWDAWLAPKTFILVSAYLATYTPTLARRISLILGKRLESIREGR